MAFFKGEPVEGYMPTAPLDTDDVLNAKQKFMAFYNGEEVEGRVSLLTFGSNWYLLKTEAKFYKFYFYTMLGWVGTVLEGGNF